MKSMHTQGVGERSEPHSLHMYIYITSNQIHQIGFLCAGLDGDIVTIMVTVNSDSHTLTLSFLQAMSVEFTDAVFYKVDVDENDVRKK